MALSSRSVAVLIVASLMAMGAFAGPLTAPLSVLQTSNNVGGLVTGQNPSGTGPYFLDFCPGNTGTTGCDSITDLGVGNFNYAKDTVNPGVFATLAANSSMGGTILDMSSAAATHFTTVVPGAGYSIANWITLAGADGSQYHFTLTQLVPASCTPSATVACVNQFLLIDDTLGHVTVTMDIKGTMTWDSDPGVLYYVDNYFSTQISGSLSSVLAAASTGTGVHASWSSTLTATPLPEPGTSAMIGGALIGLVALARKIRK